MLLIPYVIFAIVPLARPTADGVEVPDPTAAVAIGEAASLVAAGRVTSAREGLTRWLDTHPDDGGRARVAVELARVGRFDALRDAVVEVHVAGGKRLSVVLPEGKLVAAVEGVDDGVLLLGKNRLDLETLPMDGIPAAEWARLMFDRRKVGLEPDPAMLLALAVEGEAALAGAPKRFEVPDEWRRAAAEEYPAARREARWQRAFQRLAKDAAPASVDELLDALDALLLPEPPVSAAMARHAAEAADAIRRVGLERLGAAYGRLPLADLLAAEVHEDEEGIVTLTWDFETADQIRDFRPGPPLLFNDTRPGVEQLPTDDPLHIEAGRLTGSGATSLLSLVQLDTLSVRWHLWIGEEARDSLLFFDLAVNVTDTDDRVMVSGYRFLSVQHEGVWSTEGCQPDVTFGAIGPLLLRRDGAGWHDSLGGKPLLSAPLAAPRAGRLAITNAAATGRSIEELEVRGTIDGAARTELARAVARREAEARGWVAPRAPR